MHPSGAGRSEPDDGGEEDRLPPGAGVLRAALLAAAAAGVLLLLWSGWLGARFALADLSGLRFAVQGDVGPLARVLAALLEGVSGPLLLAVASALLVAAALGVGPAGRRPAPETGRRRLGRLWRDLGRLAADAARWLRDLPGRRGVGHAAALGAVVAGGLALRALYLDGPVRYDEAFTFLHFAARPAELGISRYTYPNNHLLHTLLVHLTTAVAGSSPGVLRLPAFAAGVAVVPAAYAAWDALGEPEEGLVAAAVAAGATPLVLYSVNARGYSIVVLCGLLLVPPAARLLRRRDRAAWAVFCAVAAAALYAVPVALYPVGGVLAWLVLSGRSGGDAPVRPRRTLLAEALVAVAVVAVVVAWLYQPAVQRSGVAAVVANRFVQPSAPGEFVARLPGFLGDVWGTWTAGWPAPVAAALGALALAGTARDGGRLLGAGDGAPSGEPPGERAAAAFPLVLLGWSLLLLAATRRASFARLWLFLLPLFGLQVARGLSWAAAGARRLAGRGRPAGGGARTALGPAAALLLLAGLGGSVVASDAVVESPATGPYRDGEAAARALAERLEDGDSVMAFGPAEVVLRYWHHHLGLPGEGVNEPPAPGGRVFVVVHRDEGQELADLMAKLGVAGSDRVRAEEVASFERSSVHVLLPAAPGEG